MTTSSFYVTGTDTGIGKSLVSASVLHALRAHGLQAVGMKPVASGCVHTVDGWRNDDALLLQAASDPRPAYADVNPYAFPDPVAPELAAAAVDVTLTLKPVLRAHARLAAQSEVVVVEGVGGWAAPLSATLDQIDLVRALEVPVVLVVGLRLGCINHARLTARAILADGAQLLGWVASDVDPAMDRRDENFALLQKRMPAPCWGRLLFSQAPDPRALARELHVPVRSIRSINHAGTSGTGTTDVGQC